MTHYQLVTQSTLPALIGRAELDDQLSPSRSAKDAGGVISAWRTTSEAARCNPDIKAVLDVSYGEAPAQKLDIYTAVHGEGSSVRPILLFLHGGFWQEGSKDASGFPAPAFVEAGWVFVAVGYTLAPRASLSVIAEEVKLALRTVRELAPSFDGDCERIVVSGHSAGAHLACLLMQGTSPVHAGATQGSPIAGVVAISGVFDLRPIRRSYVNDKLRLGDDEAADLSPILSLPVLDIPVVLVVGADDTAEFRRQTAALFQSWKPHLTRLSVEVLPARDHFDILLDLADPASRLFHVITNL